MGNEQEREKSEFNSAVQYLNRLNELWFECNVYSRSMALDSWVKTLNRLFNELSTEMNKEEEKDKLVELQDLFSEALGKKDLRNRTNSTLYWKINNFELWLRNIMKDSGLQQKMKEDTSFAIK